MSQREVKEAVIHRRHCSTKFEATKNSTMPATMAIVASGTKTTMSWYQNATRWASSATWMALPKSRWKKLKRSASATWN